MDRWVIAAMLAYLLLIGVMLSTALVFIFSPVLVTTVH